MRRVISTKVDQAKHAEFLEYCAKTNKYPANAMMDALDLLLCSDKARDGNEHGAMGVEEKSRHPPSRPQELESVDSTHKCVKEGLKPNVDEDEAELE